MANHHKQKKMSHLIDELEEKLDLNKPEPEIKDKNKKVIKEVTKNARQLYKTRNDIINAFEG